MKPTFPLVLALLLGTTWAFGETASSSPATRRGLLGEQLRPYQMTSLEYQLLLVNLKWVRHFEGSVDYLNSYSISFDFEKAQFYTAMRISEKRSHEDEAPFFSLPEREQRASMMEAVDYLLDLLSQPFPEVRKDPALVVVDFAAIRDGKRIEVARYAGGRLELLPY